MKKISYPHRVRVGNAKVTIYKREMNSGNTGFQVVFIDTDGSRRMLSAADEATALDLAEQKATMLSTHGVKVASVSGDEISEYVHASDVLMPFSVTVRDGVAHLCGWLKTHKTLAGIDAALANAGAVLSVGVIAKTVPAARLDYVAELNASVKAGDLSDSHVRDFDGRLRRILEPFNCDVSTVTTEMLQARLNVMNGGASNYEHNRRALSAFFGWCFCQKFHMENPAFTPKKQLQVRGLLYLKRRESHVDPDKRQIFTIEETWALLKNAPRSETVAEDYFLPTMAICNFLGLRTSEFIRLRWEDFDLSHGMVEIGRGERKTQGSWRSIKLPDNLRVLLEEFKDRKGFVFSNRGDTFARTCQRVNTAQKICARTAGIRWKKNAPRHSYISYRLARGDSKNTVADDAGTSVAKLDSNYKSLRFADGRFITEKDASAWFTLEIPKREKL